MLVYLVGSEVVGAELEAGVGIGPFSPQLRDKNAHFPKQINLNLLNHTKPILTGLVSVLVSADEQVDFLRPVNFHRFKCHWLARFGTVLCLSAGDLKRHWAFDIGNVSV